MKRKFYMITLLLAVGFLLWHKGTSDTMNPTFRSNPNLKTIAPNDNWKGTPIDTKGKYTNLYHPFESSFKDLLKWKLGKNPQKKEKKNDESALPIFYDPALFEKDEYMIWLGHATFLIRTNGLTMITDPMLFDNMFLKRKSPLPFPLAKLPKIDIILLSHNHRDHCDKNSIEYLTELNPNSKVLTGLGMKYVVSDWTNNRDLIQEAGWFQQYNLEGSDLSITFVPTRHWSRRGLFDQNDSLWGGFFIKNGKHSIYFMGDSGKGPHFEDIFQALGKPDYCIMGVGAFRPEWFMHQSHINPTDAIDAFHIMQGSYFIPMHFGTFDLSDERLMEPWEILKSNRDKVQGTLIEPVLGKNLIVSKVEQEKTARVN